VQLDNIDLCPSDRPRDSPSISSHLVVRISFLRTFQNDAVRRWDIINDGGVRGGGEGAGGGLDTCPGGRSEGGKQSFKMVK